MSKITIAKVAGLAVGATVAFGAFVPMAGAVTVAELQAQINALMAQLSSLQGGTTVSTGTQITSDLTIGSTGSQVVALQQALVANGHLVMPAGVAMGYFGSLTKSAVAKWQAANGVPGTGYFGPLSRAKFNAGMSTTVPGTTIPGATTPSGITTPGVEGTITVTKAPSPASGTKVYEGESMKKVLGVEIEAKTSDMKVERIKIDLDETGNTATADSAFYNKFADRIYVMDGSTVLASIDVNSSTIVEESNEISITLAGLSVVVPKNTKKTLTVALDAKASWDSSYDDDTWTVGVAASGVRAVDGAGVNQYGPSSAFSNSVTSSADILDSATLSISTNAGTPDVQDVICTSGVDEDECDELEVLRFNLKAEDDDVTVTDLVVDLTQAGATGASTTVAYLYDGSTLVASETVDHDDGASAITFADIDWVVSEGSTKVFSLRLDVVDTDATRDTWVADIDTADVTSENSRGDGVTESGSATGNAIGVRKIGPEVSLVSKSIVTSGAPQSSTSSNFSTSTLTATFNIKVTAKGGDVLLGTVASGSPVFANTGSSNSFHVYENGVISNEDVATSTSYSIPSACVSEGSNTCVLAENSEVTIPVTFVMPGRSESSSAVSSALYSVQFAGLQYVPKNNSSSVLTSQFMSSDTDWRTADVSFP